MDESIYIILLLFIIYIYLKTKNRDILLHKINNVSYYIRNLPDKDNAIGILNKIRENLNKLIDDILREPEINKHEYYAYINKIKEKLKTVVISETSKYSPYTSYTVNKGDEMIFCLRSKQDDKIHDINELMYVAIHEVAHIGCPEIGHTTLFNNINHYLLEKAIKYEIYKYIDYSIHNMEYCGLTLKNNIYK